MLGSGRSRFARQLWLAAVCAGVVAAFGATPAWAGHGKGQAKGHAKKGGGKKAGAAYTQTNDPAGNEVVVYRRAANGKLTELKRVSTGGVGAASTPPFGFPIVDSQGSLELTKNGRLLFAVNAGDDTVSSFRVKGNRLKLVDRESSGGDLPVSLDSKGKLLYVVNSLSGDISGLRFNRKGQMTPIPGSTEPFAPPGGGGAPAQLGFAPKGRVITVTLRGPNVIDTFILGSDGTPGPAKSNTSNAPSPFGFEYQRAGNLIVSNAGDTGNPPDPTNPANFHGSASSYKLDTASGTLTAIENEPIPGQRATCWVVITNNDKYAFMTNTLSNSVSRFSLTKGGDMTLLGNTATGPGFASDEALSRNSKYLYVLLPSIMGGSSHIDAYRVGSGGTLTHIQATASNLPPGVSGMAAR